MENAIYNKRKYNLKIKNQGDVVMDYSKIKFSICEGIANIVLSGPKNYNAMNSTMITELNSVLDTCASDWNVKAIVISGEGKAFCSGGDIAEMVKGLKAGELVKFRKSMDESGIVTSKIRDIDKPVIASVHGAAAGAGFNLALACDFRIAAENSRFIQSFVQVGLVPDMGGIYFLSKLIGYARATELCMTGREVKAEEAFKLGLVNKVVPVEALEEETVQFAKKIAAGPSAAYSKIKDLINKVTFNELEEHLTAVSQYQIQSAMTLDFQEGITAFMQKRKPEFQGR